MPSDSELLLRYARTRDETAFAELVQGHIALVYSAALRRTGGDPHAATEITQGVFIALARNAARLASHPVLNAWLHASTRNAAINLRRREQRRERQLQEIQAMQELTSSERLAQEWQLVRGVLDESLDELSESDRRAIILRFFENQTYPAIGGILGLQEEAARMRVGRALEKLRTRLTRRGIASTAALLGGALSANSVVSVPTGLAATTTTAASAVGLAIPFAGILQLMSMTKLTGTFVALAAVIAVGTISYRHGPLSNSRASVDETFRPPSIPQPETEKVRPPSTVAPVDAAAPASPPPILSETDRKVLELREFLSRFPEQGIPELKLITDADWQTAVASNLETPDDYQYAIASLRTLAERRFATLLQPALSAFLQANNQQFPTDVAQLRPFVGDHIDGAMLSRYRVAPGSEIPNMKFGDWIITQHRLINPDYDMLAVIGGRSSGSTSSPLSAEQRANEVMMSMVMAHHAATGVVLRDFSKLASSATTPEQKAALEFIELSRRRRSERQKALERAPK